jgi:phenylpropionate dioxygenase-like ring-hydroxylating dioxygenase large terminal subunit
MAVGFSAQLPEPGDIFPLTVLGCPILLTRDNNRQVRAFHNVGPYDSCEISVDPQTGLDRIVTPYHGWEYGLDGKLLAANYWDGTKLAKDVSLTDLDADLIPVACQEWMGTLFVFLDDGATDFSSENDAVLTHCERMDLDRLQIGEDTNGAVQINALRIASNWKTVYENYSPNVYHESFVHAMYRKSPHSPRVDANGQKTYSEINDPSGFLGLCYDNKIGTSFYGDANLPPLRLKDGSPNGHNTIANVFPNWVITLLGDCARMALFLPDGPESGTQMVATFFDCDGATSPIYAEDRERSARQGVIAREEDNRICESIQRARHSPAVDSQFYSPFWDAMHYTLSNLILNRLEQGES